MKTTLLFLTCVGLSYGQQTFNELRALGTNVQQNGAVTNGGYVVFSPVDYNPYGGAVCHDQWGNPVQQPTPTTSGGAFGVNDLVLWNSLSPSMPFTGGAGLVQGMIYDNPSAAGPCGIPLTVNLLYGLNTNGYFFARGGLATDQGYYNAIQALQGGVLAGSFTAGIWYPAGTVTACCGTLSVGAYLGGHVDTGHSVGPPASGTIASVTNPFTGGEGLVAGQIYFDDNLGCENVYTGSAWGCMPHLDGSGVLTAAGGFIGGVFNCTATGGTSCVQQSSGTFIITGAGNIAGQSLALHNGLTVDSGAYGLSAGGLLTASGAIAPVFNCSATGATNCIQQASGTFTITGAGAIAAQSLTLTSGLTVDSGAYGFSGSGALTAVSAVAPIFNCSATGSSNCVQQASGTFTITGAGAIAAQSLALTSGLTVDSGAYGLSGSGALTVISAVAPIFNCSATGSSNCVQQASGTFTITGAGAIAAQSLALTSGLTVDSGTYGLSAGGALTVASCSGCGSGGVTSFNTRTGAVTLAKADVTAVDQALGTGDSPTFAGATAGIFNCTATGGTSCMQQSSGTFNITGAGAISAQSLALTSGLTVDSGTYGLSAGGALTVASCSGCGSGSVSSFNTRTGAITLAKADVTAVDQALGTGDSPTFAATTAGVFNCTATGGTSCMQQSSGAFIITGAGAIAAQSLALTSGLTVDSGTYGLSGLGILTAANIDIPGFTVVDAAANIAGNSLTITGTLTGSGGALACVTTGGRLYRSTGGVC